MASITFKNVAKKYSNGNDYAVRDFSMKVEHGDFIVLVGPSGCGKSTTLRMIAGLEDITEGELYIGDKLVNGVEPKDRDIAMVFQNYALYPHMSVFDNMAFGLKLRKMPKNEIKMRVEEAAEMLDITPYLKRKPKALSGGQQQRVALGRAIVRNTDVFLMDEPLSNLDAKLRVVMRSEILKLYRKIKTTFIYVTHDQTEAMTMGSHIVVMKDGIIQQIESPTNLYNKPENRFVAQFIGSPQMNVWSGRLERRGDKAVACMWNIEIVISESRAKMIDKDAFGGEVLFGIRPEHIIPKGDNSIDMEVDLYEQTGSDVFLITVPNNTQEKINVRLPATYNIQAGEKISLCFDTENLYVFDTKTEKTLIDYKKA